MFRLTQDRELPPWPVYSHPLAQLLLVATTSPSRNLMFLSAFCCLILRQNSEKECSTPTQEFSHLGSKKPSIYAPIPSHLLQASGHYAKSMLELTIGILPSTLSWCHERSLPSQNFSIQPYCPPCWASILEDRSQVCAPWFCHDILAKSYNSFVNDSFFSWSRWSIFPGVQAEFWLQLLFWNLWGR